MAAILCGADGRFSTVGTDPFVASFGFTVDNSYKAQVLDGRTADVSPAGCPSPR